MSEEFTTEESTFRGYPRLVHTTKLFYDMLTVRGETGDEIQEGMASFAAVAGEVAKAGTAIKNAFGVSAQAEEAEAKRSQSSAAPAQGARKPYTRSAKPSPGAPTTVADGETPVCQCGVPYNDVRGKVYGPSNAKAGQPYPNSFYSACDNKCPAIK